MEKDTDVVPSAIVTSIHSMDNALWASIRASPINWKAVDSDDSSGKDINSDRERNASPAF